MVNDFSAFTGNQHVLPSITDSEFNQQFFFQVILQIFEIKKYTVFT